MKILLQSSGNPAYGNTGELSVLLNDSGKLVSSACGVKQKRNNKHKQNKIK